jgi:uncharacterized metal-binding protein
MGRGKGAVSGLASHATFCGTAGLGSGNGCHFLKALEGDRLSSIDGRNVKNVTKTRASSLSHG